MPTKLGMNLVTCTVYDFALHLTCVSLLQRKGVRHEIEAHICAHMRRAKTHTDDSVLSADIYRGLFKFGVFNAVQSKCFEKVSSFGNSFRSCPETTSQVMDGDDNLVISGAVCNTPYSKQNLPFCSPYRQREDGVVRTCHYSNAAAS